MNKASDNPGRQPFHRGWIGIMLAIAAMLAVVLWSGQGNWLRRQVGLNLQATGLEAMSTPPGKAASKPSTHPTIKTAPKGKGFCPT